MKIFINLLFVLMFFSIHAKRSTRQLEKAKKITIATHRTGLEICTSYDKQLGKKKQKKNNDNLQDLLNLGNSWSAI